jgi:flagellar motor switch/type III secretory pathway protein FliN
MGNLRMAAPPQLPTARARASVAEAEPDRPGEKPKEELVASGPQALVPLKQLVAETTRDAFGPRVRRLPVEVNVAAPVRNFRVRRLLALAPGEVIESQWTNGSDLPLMAGNVRLAWAEFEVVDTKLAVRVTHVA